MEIKETLPLPWLIATTSSKQILSNPIVLSLTDSTFSRGSSVPNQPAGVFWAVVASLLIICQTIILGRQFLSLSTLIFA